MTQSQKRKLLKERYEGTIWQMGIDYAIKTDELDLCIAQLQSQFEDSPATMKLILPEYVCCQLFKI